MVCALVCLSVCVGGGGQMREGVDLVCAVVCAGRGEGQGGIATTRPAGVVLNTETSLAGFDRGIDL